MLLFFFSSRRRHTRWPRDWSSDVCSSDLIRSLRRKPQIIIGTPGRLLDHINRKTIRLDSVQTVVLDEADEMLDMGFLDDIQAILEQVPTERHKIGRASCRERVERAARVVR